MVRNRQRQAWLQYKYVPSLVQYRWVLTITDRGEVVGEHSFEGSNAGMHEAIQWAEDKWRPATYHME